MKPVKYFHNLFLLIFLVKLSQDTFRFKNKVGVTGAGQPSSLYHCSSASSIKKVQEQCSSICVGNSPAPQLGSSWEEDIHRPEGPEPLFYPQLSLLWL